MTVPLGTPITTEQATLAVLRLIKSEILGDVNLDWPGRTLSRIYGDKGCYHMLSGGEKNLADIAFGIWNPKEGARIGAIGGLDTSNRRKVIVILAYLHLGNDLDFDLDPVQFRSMFGDRITEVRYR